MLSASKLTVFRYLASFVFNLLYLENLNLCLFILAFRGDKFNGKRRKASTPLFRMFRSSPWMKTQLKSILLLKCPYCMKTTLLEKGWFKFIDQCPHCHNKFERKRVFYWGALDDHLSFAAVFRNHGGGGVSLFSWNHYDGKNLSIATLGVFFRV